MWTWLMGRLTNLKPALATLDVRTAQPAPKVADDFYSSKPWRALVSDVLRERGRTCEHCGTREGRVYLDHIIELKDGGAPLARSNVQVLCASCHGLKTHAVRRQRWAGL